MKKYLYLFLLSPFLSFTPLDASHERKKVYIHMRENTFYDIVKITDSHYSALGENDEILPFSEFKNRITKSIQKKKRLISKFCKKTLDNEKNKLDLDIPENLQKIIAHFLFFLNINNSEGYSEEIQCVEKGSFKFYGKINFEEMPLSFRPLLFDFYRIGNEDYRFTKNIVRETLRVSASPTCKRHCYPYCSHLILACICPSIDTMNFITEDNSGLLRWACFVGDIEILKFLLKSKNIDQYYHPAGYPKSVLHYACKYGRLDMVKLLLDNGVNIYPTSRNKITPLMFACKSKNLKLVKFLMPKCKEMINKSNKKKKTALHFAIIAKSFPVAQFLIEEGINIRDRSNKSSLAYACKHNCLDILRLLIKNGEDIHETRKGKTLLHLVCKKEFYKKYLALIDFLIEAGVNVNKKDRDGNTAFHFVCKNISFNNKWGLEIVKLFMENGTNIDEKNIEGITPLEYIPKERIALKNFCLNFKNNSTQPLIEVGVGGRR